MRRSAWVVGFLALSFVGGACGGPAASSGANAKEPVASKTWEDGPPPQPAPDAKLSQAECTKLFDHIVELMQKGMPPDEWAQGKDDLAQERDGMIKDCQDGETTRAQFNCLMAATELPQVKDCVPQQ